MVTDFRRQKKKQKYLLIIVVLIMLTISGVLYFGFFGEDESIVEITPITSIKEININFNILENPLFEKIKPFEKIPEFEGEVGRENPFLPY